MGSANRPHRERAAGTCGKGGPRALGSPAPGGNALPTRGPAGPRGLSRGLRRVNCARFATKAMPLKEAHATSQRGSVKEVALRHFQLRAPLTLAAWDQRFSREKTRDDAASFRKRRLSVA